MNHYQMKLSRGLSFEVEMDAMSFFFFQAEDGIRDYKVTGVQTCALPIGDYTIPKWLKGEDRLTLRVVASDAEGINVGYDEIPYPLAPGEKSRDAPGRDIPPIGK